jgi:outer membrane lipoprotein carrier protein
MMMRGVLLSLLLVLPLAVKAAAASTALDRYLDGLTTWSAQFTQSVVDANGRAAGRGSGSLTIVRPGKFRWSFTPAGAPEGAQLLVADGRNLWFQDSDLEQVTVKPMDAALSQTPAMLLSGGARIADSFEVAPAGHDAGLEWVKVTPRGADADFKSARLGFAGQELKRMVLDDKLGQVATLQFTDSTRNRPVPADSMRYTPPAGFNVIGTALK